jgi:pimeloyl-ACP methyl ester carboxylesterase
MTAQPSVQTAVARGAAVAKIDVGEGAVAMAICAHSKERIESSEIMLAAGGVELAATLRQAPHARGIILFAHGSGSSRFSVRNRSVAATLEAAGLSTLLLDLLTADEERIDAMTRHLRFDIELLAKRLAGATRWLQSHAQLARLAVGYFGASTGAAAALVAATHIEGVGAIVSRGGRPDLAGDALARLSAPTLLIVGGADREVLSLNRLAQARMACLVRLEVVPGATHLFEEPGALEQVATLAADWFIAHLGDGAARARPGIQPSTAARHD